MNLFQHTKYLIISSICSRDKVHLKILQFDWPVAFWSISQEPDFSQIWTLYSDITNNINFNCRPNSEILFLGQNKNPALSHKLQMGF